MRAREPLARASAERPRRKRGPDESRTRPFAARSWDWVGSKDRFFLVTSLTEGNPVGLWVSKEKVTRPALDGRKLLTLLLLSATSQQQSKAKNKCRASARKRAGYFLSRQKQPRPFAPDTRRRCAAGPSAPGLATSIWRACASRRRLRRSRSFQTICHWKGAAAQTRAAARNSGSARLFVPFPAPVLGSL